MGKSTESEKLFLHELVRTAYPDVYERCMKMKEEMEEKKELMSTQTRKRRVSYSPATYSENVEDEG